MRRRGAAGAAEALLLCLLLDLPRGQGANEATKGYDSGLPGYLHQLIASGARPTMLTESITSGQREEHDVSLRRSTLRRMTSALSALSQRSSGSEEREVWPIEHVECVYRYLNTDEQPPRPTRLFWALALFQVLQVPHFIIGSFITPGAMDAFDGNSPVFLLFFICCFSVFMAGCGYALFLARGMGLHVLKDDLFVGERKLSAKSIKSLKRFHKLLYPVRVHRTVAIAFDRCCRAYEGSVHGGSVRQHTIAATCGQELTWNVFVGATTGLRTRGSTDVPVDSWHVHRGWHPLHDLQPHLGDDVQSVGSIFSPTRDGVVLLAVCCRGSLQ